MNSKRSTVAISSDQIVNNNSMVGSKFSLGVYSLENRQCPQAAWARMEITKDLCLANAIIYAEHGHQSKADTWRLLAQTVQSVLTFENDEFDGFGGDDDALTTGIVEQILRYYEAEGDYQMLSTIVCVLTFGRDRRILGSTKATEAKSRYNLLPRFDERRYDNYLHRYSALLYGWATLVVRNEIAKRLAYPIPGAGGEIVTSIEPKLLGSDAVDSSTVILPNAGVSIGISFSALCQKCMGKRLETVALFFILVTGYKLHLLILSQYLLRTMPCVKVARSTRFSVRYVIYV